MIWKKMPPYVKSLQRRSQSLKSMDFIANIHTALARPCMPTTTCPSMTLPETAVCAWSFAEGTEHAGSCHSHEMAYGPATSARKRTTFRSRISCSSMSSVSTSNKLPKESIPHHEGFFIPAETFYGALVTKYLCVRDVRADRCSLFWSLAASLAVLFSDPALMDPLP